MNEEEKKAIRDLIDSSNLSLIGDGTIITSRETIGIILNLIETQKAELEKYKAIELKAKGGAVKITLERLLNLQAELKKKDKEINRLKDELGYTRKLV